MPKVKFHKTNDSYFGVTEEGVGKNMEEIIESIGRAWSASPINLQEFGVETRPTNLDELAFPKGIAIDEDIEDLDGLQITEENQPQLVAILERIARILKNPKEVFKHLKNLDDALGEKMTEQGINKIENQPQYLIAGVGNFLPGPWPENYRPLKKNRILNSELLKREQAAGINLDGVARYDRFVQHEDANHHVREGNIFTDNEQASKFLFHGKNTHRLFLEIVRQAVKSGDLDLEVDGQQLTQKQLLQLLIFSFNKSAQQLTWASLIDSTQETNEHIEQGRKCSEQEYRERSLDPNNYCFSSRSPLIFKSLITCFGKDELPNLSAYLLDSHYKQVAQMVYKIREEDAEENLHNVPDEFIYTCCMDIMSTGRDFCPEQFKHDFPFLAPSPVEQSEEFSPKYSKNIRRKKSHTDQNSSKPYESIEVYGTTKLQQKSPKIDK